MHYANLMRILYRKGNLNEADPVSRLPNFLPIDNLHMPDESLWYDGKEPDIDTNGNDPELLSLSTLKALSVDDDFLSNSKGENSTCEYFYNDNYERRLRQKIEKSFDGLFRSLKLKWLQYRSISD